MIAAVDFRYPPEDDRDHGDAGRIPDNRYHGSWPNASQRVQALPAAWKSWTLTSPSTTTSNSADCRAAWACV
jgi:hypothetical protein